MRACVWIPDELAETVRHRLPELNMSKVLQEGLRALLECRHADLACAACGEALSQAEIEDVILGRFYGDLMWELRILVDRGGTAEGAARVAKEVGSRYRITLASNLPLPRATKQARTAAKVKDFPMPGEGRRSASAS